MRRFAAFPAAKPLKRSLLFKKAGQNTGRRDAAPYRKSTHSVLFGSFCRSKKNQPVSLSGAFHCMESMPLSGQHASRAFTPFLLETWSPCSHPFAILPVSAVSDAQKLATGNFLHVRARAFCVTFCTPQKVTSHLPRRETRGFANLESAHTGGSSHKPN